MGKPKEAGLETDGLHEALGALAKHVIGQYSKLQPHTPTGDPNQFWHTFDCNLHTILFDGVQHDTVQALNLVKQGLTRLQFLSTVPELYFFVDVDNKSGAVEYLFLDRALEHKKRTVFKDIATAVEELGRLTKPTTAKRVAVTALLTGLPTESLTLAAAAKRWEQVESVAKGYRGKVELVIKTKLALQPGLGDLQPEMATLLKGLKAEQAKGGDLGVGAFARAVATNASRDDFGVQLAQAWGKPKKRPPSTRWILDASAEVGGGRTVDALGSFAAALLGDSAAHHQVCSIAAALERMGTMESVQELFHIAAVPSRYLPRRTDARERLENIASSGGMDFDTLVSSAIPGELDAAAQKRFVAAQGRRLDRAMVDGRRYLFSAVQKAPPLLADVYSHVVWATFDGAGQVSASFMLKDGQPISVDQSPMNIIPSSSVGVVHPVELGDAAVKAWAKVAKPKDQPFLQLARPVHYMTAKQRESNEIYDFKFFKRDWLHELEWWGLRYNLDWAGSFDSFAVISGRDRKHIEAKMSNTGGLHKIGLGRMRDNSEKKDGYWVRSTEESTFGDLHPVTQSEIIYAFRGDKVSKPVRAQGGTSNEKSRVAPPRTASPNNKDASAASASPAAKAAGGAAGKYPFAEMAKSSRSLCLVCEQKILKDTVRVVVERKIESGAFTGLGAGYLHVACAPLYPELAELGDLDDRIAKNSDIPWPPN